LVLAGQPAIQPQVHGWLLLVLLVAAIAMLDVVAIVAMQGKSLDWPRTAAVMAMGAAFCQVGLGGLLVLAIWPRWWFRGAIAGLLHVGAAIIGSRATSEEFWPWLGIMLLDLAIVAAPLLAARLAGMRIVPVDRLDDLPPASRQYSILGVLALTTLVAVLLGIARAIATWGDVAQVAIFAMGLGAIPWACGTLALSGFRWYWAVIAGSIVCPLAGYGIAFTDFPPRHPTELIVMCCVQGALTIAACSVVKVAGYRLVWPTWR
jgi:hypothetical protein